MRIGSLLRNLLILCVFLAFPLTASAQQGDAISVVQRFQDHLLGVMKEAKSLTVRQRYERLLPGIEDAFSVPVMIGTATGAYWKQATAEEKDRLVTAFKRNNISTVATLFDGYSGQVFKIEGERPAPQNTRLIKTKIVTGRSSCRSTTGFWKWGRWRIIDVIVDDGISEMSVRRSEYGNILKNQGINGLIATLTAKADELLSK